MNINLIYQNNSFNFDLRKDASIKYLEDLASKLINKDKASFNLSYKDNILSEGPNTLLKDILKTETNVHITISPKLNRSGRKIKKILPKLKISNQSISNTESIETKNNLIMNDTELSQSFTENSIKVLQHLSKHNFEKNKKQKNDYFTKNKVFEEIYNSKENELLKYLKILSQKIKEYDDCLYKKYKKSFNRNNNELLLFEKNIMNFKDKQIKFIKKLIDFFDNNEKDFLDELYKELDKYDNKQYTIEYNSIITKKKKIEDIKLSPINKTENNYSNSHKDLPLLIKNNNININNSINQLCLSQKIIKNNRNDNKEIKDEKSLFANRNGLQLIPNISINNSKNKQDLLYNNNNDLNIKEINNKSDNKSNKKTSVENTTKANSNQSENSNASKAPDRQVNSTKKITNMSKQKISSNKTNNNNNNNINNNNQIDNQNKIQDGQNNKQNNVQSNLENNTKNNIHNDLLIHLNQKLKKDENIKKEKKKNNTNENMKEKEERRRRASNVDSIEYNRKKVSTLFEISESFINENKKSDNSSSSHSSEDESETSRKRKENNINHYFNGYDEIKNFKRKYESKSSKKSINYTNVKNPKIGYLIKVKNRKINQRIKRLGSNINDFLI